MSRVSSVRAKKCSLLSAHQCRHCMQRISKERSKDQDTDVSLYTKGLYYYSGWGPFIYDVTTLSHLSSIGYDILDLDKKLVFLCTLPIDRILSAKNAWAWVSMLLYLKG